MINEIKSEFLKEKRSANARLLVIVPIVFIIFNVLLVGLMGRSPAGRSYLMATAFNWYPLLVLPVVLSILVININNKEKEEHIAFRKSHGFKYGSSIVAKNVVVMSEILCIILLSSVFVYVFGVYVMKDDISNGELRCFLIAEYEGCIVGTIEYGPASDLINSCTHGKYKNLYEIGTVFVRPDYQGQGIGNLLLNAMIQELQCKGIKEFCMDSGYSNAQKIWRKRFGEPEYFLENYWAEGQHHLIWKIKI